MWSDLRVLVAFSLVSATLLAACGDDAPTQPRPPNPVIASISPEGKFQGEESFSLAISGSDFVNRGADPVVHWNGTPRTTRRIDDTGLWADIEAADLETPGEAEVQVLAFSAAGDTIPSNTVTFRVLPAPVAITVVPSEPAVAVGSSLQLRASAELADGSTAAVRELVAWSVDELRVARVSNQSGSRGQLTGTGSGATRVYARLFGLVGTARLIVGELTSIEIDPGTAELTIGESVQLSAAGRFADGAGGDLTSLADWTSLEPDVAEFVEAPGSVGLLVAVASGTATIRAELAGVRATIDVTVVAP